jgi:hypothetical protein
LNIYGFGTLPMRYWLCAIILCAGLTCAQAQTFGDWRVSFGQGYLQHFVERGPGNSFNISCDTGVTDTGEKSGILIKIGGRYPPPNSMVRVFIGDDDYQVLTDERGGSVLDCRACHGNFVAIWRALRRHSTMRILMADGRTVQFSTRGGNRALSPRPCKTGW